MRIDHEQAFQQRVMLLDFTVPVEDNLKRMLVESKVFGFGVSRKYQPKSLTDKTISGFQESEIFTNLGESRAHLSELVIRVPAFGGYYIYTFSRSSSCISSQVNIDTSNLNLVERFVSKFVSKSNAHEILTCDAAVRPIWKDELLFNAIHEVSPAQLFLDTLNNSGWVDANTLEYSWLPDHSVFKPVHFTFKHNTWDVLIELEVSKVKYVRNISSSPYEYDVCPEDILQISITLYHHEGLNSPHSFTCGAIESAYCKAWKAVIENYQENITKLDEAGKELEKEKVLEIHITDTGSNPPKTQIRHLPHNFTSMDQIVSAIDTIANQTELVVIQKKWWQFWKK